ncbi:MAG: GCN5-related N-acetyltransferase [candidate division NC10 bacterium]|nr:GCN5-related N-acetyltransferase [candidate division NC10 bacterium]
MTERRIDQARPAGVDDIAALGSLMVAFYAEAEFSLTRAAAERTFAALPGAPALGVVWLVESGGQAAGFVVLTVSFSMEYGGLRGFVDDFGAQRLSSGWLCRHQAPASQGRVEPTGALRRGW